MSEKLLCPMCAIAYGYHAEGCPALMGNSAAIATPPASQESAVEEFARLRGSERRANYAETRYWCEQYRLFGSKAVDAIATLTAELAEARTELEKETAQSKHLAEAMSRKIQELIAAENQCAYYKGQYTRAEQVRKEACEANIKAQAKTLWLEDELAEAREQRDRWIREAGENIDIARDVIAERDSLRDECKRLLPLARRTLWLAFTWNDHNFAAAHECARAEAALLGIHSRDDANEFLAALSASGREGVGRG